MLDYEAVVTEYIRNEWQPDKKVFDLLGLRIEKCIYLLEKEILYLKNAGVDWTQIILYLTIPFDDRLHDENALTYNRFKFLACTLPPIVVCKAICRIYEQDFDALWKNAKGILCEDVVFAVGYGK